MMKKKSIILLVVFLALIAVSCKDVMEETMYDKELERGQWSSSKFNKATWGE